MARSKTKLSDKLLSVLLSILMILASFSIIFTVGKDTQAAEDTKMLIFAVKLTGIQTNGSEKNLNRATVDCSVYGEDEETNAPSDVLKEENVKSISNSSGLAFIRVDSEKINNHHNIYYVRINAVKAYGFDFTPTDETVKLDPCTDVKSPDNIYNISLNQRKKKRIYGTVTDINNIPVKSADITFKYYNDGKFTVQSDENGSYKADLYFDEDYTVKATGVNEAAGQNFQVVTQYVNIKSGDTEKKTYDFVLPERVEDTHFQFAQKDDRSLSYVKNNSEYVNPVIRSSDNDSKISYTVLFNGEETKKAVYHDGKLNYLAAGPGSYTVIARSSDSEKYLDKEIQFHVTVESESVPFEFAETSRTVSITDKDVPLELQKITNELYSEEYISYTVSGDKGVVSLNQSEKTLTLKKVGTVTITAKYNHLDTVQASYTLNVIKESVALKFEDSDANITFRPKSSEGGFASYQRKALYWNEKTGTYEEISDVKYFITEQYNTNGVLTDGIASVNQTTGLVTAKAAGKVVVTASLGSSKQYEGEDISYTLHISKADQPEISFSEKEPTITFKTNTKVLTYQNTFHNNSLPGTVVYEITEGSDNAVIDSKGKLTILKAGTVKVRATKITASANYNDISIAYVLHAEKGTPALSLGTKLQQLTYGSELKVIEPKVSPGNLSDEEKKLTYTFRDVENAKIKNVIKSIDNNGMITLNDNKAGGMAVITVTLAETDCYQSVSKDYKIKVDYHNKIEYEDVKDGDMFTVNKEDKIDADGIRWYNTTEGVQFEAKDGYQISASNSLDESNWHNTYSYHINVKNKKITFYTRKTEGGKLGAVSKIVMNNVNVDTIGPELISVNYSQEKNSFENIIDTLTFHLFSYHQPIKVTAKVTDNLSGIESVKLNYTKENMSDASDSQELELVNTYTDSKKRLNAEFIIPDVTSGEIEEYLKNVTFTMTDNAGNVTSANQDNRINIYDTVSPDTVVKINGIQQIVGRKSGQTKNDLSKEDYDLTADGRNLYFNEKASASIVISDLNFDPNIEGAVSFVVKKYNDDGSSSEVAIGTNGVSLSEWKRENNQWHSTLVIENTGDYVFTFKCVDRSGNKMAYKGDKTIAKYTSDRIIIDKTIPVISVEYQNTNIKNSIDGIDYYDQVQTAKIIIREHNFRANDVAASITAKDVTGKDIKNVAAKLEKYLSNPNNWKTSGMNSDIHIAELVFDTEANYTFDIAYQDLAFNKSVDYEEYQFTYDKTAPKVNISYEQGIDKIILSAITFGIYNPSVTVTLTASDNISGVGSFDWSYAKQKGASSMNANTQHGTITADQMTYSSDGKSASAKFTLDGAEYQYRGLISYSAADRSGNSSDELTRDKGVIVDTVAPELTVSYEKEQGSYHEKLYYSDTTTATLTVNEANFTANRVRVQLNGKAYATSWKNISEDHYEAAIQISEERENQLTVSYTDIAGNKADTYTSPVIVIDRTAPVLKVEYENTDVKNTIDGIDYYDSVQTAKITITEHHFRISEDNLIPDITAKNVAGADIGRTAEEIAEYLYDESNWETSEENPDVHTIKVNFDTEANYIFDIDYKDLALNDANDCKQYAFTVDKTAPDVSISYSSNLVSALLETVTFGFYRSDVTVTLTASDDISPVNRLEWSYHKQSGASDINRDAQSGTIQSDKISYSADRRTAVSQFTLAGQYRGFITYSASDRAENRSSDITDKNGIIVDNISPTCSVIIEECKQSANGKRYYNDTVSATVTINEANFIADDITIKLNGEIYKSSWKNTSGDIYETKITISEERDNRFTVEAVDHSGNKTDTYTSPVLVIDRTAPTIRVAYQNNDVQNRIDHISYYQSAQTAVVTVHEHNFRASDVTGNITAKDVSGNEIAGIASRLESLIRDSKNWKSSGDTHTLEIPFDSSANYSFALNYKDLALNSAKTYTANPFTVDTGKPKNVHISYSKSVVDLILENITFGIYQSPVTVTVTAYDDIAGINRFDLSYNRADNASTSNIRREPENQNQYITLSSGNITYSSDKKTASAKYTFGKGQYKGNISYSAADRAKNTVSYKDIKGIIVDTVAPQCSVTYQPCINIKNNVMYYDGATEVSVKIKEANFLPGDVYVALNNARYNMEWIQSSETDTYIGTIRIAREESNFFTINYTDRSTNRMTEYVSPEIVIDTVDPVIESVVYSSEPISTVAGRKYYNKNITATLTVLERNFDADNFDIALTAFDAVDQTFPVNYLKSDWSHSGSDRHSITLTFNVDANYDFAFSCKDLAKRSSARFTDPITVDKTPPKNLTVSYSSDIFHNVINTLSFGFYQSPVTVTVSAADDTTAIRKFDYSYIKSSGVSKVNAELMNEAVEASRIVRNGKTASASFSVPRGVLGETNQFRGTVGFTAYDTAENQSINNDNKIIIVDNISPEITFGFDTPIRKSENTFYYNDALTVSVIVTEANFFAEDVQISLEKNGKHLNKTVSAVWSDNGDVHTGTFRVSDEGEYYVSVTYKDRSGNQSAKTSDKFVIDKSKPAVTLSNISNKSAMNDNGNIGFVLKANDSHFDNNSFKPTLTVLTRDENGNFVTKEIDISQYLKRVSDTEYRYEIENLEYDGIYTLRNVVTDRSDMAQNQITVDGQNLDEVVFSINRNGSTFRISDEYTQSITGSVIQGVEKNIVIEEINVVPTKDARIQLENTDLTMLEDGDRTSKGYWTEEKAGTSTEWYSKTYYITPDSFKSKSGEFTEGEQNIRITTTDETGSTSYNDSSSNGSAKIQFIIDHTAPILTISGVRSDSLYQSGKQHVIVSVSEKNRIDMFRVSFADTDGKSTGSTLFDSDDIVKEKGLKDFSAYLSENKNIEFDIPEGYSQNIIFECRDEAGNAVDVDKYMISNVTVSTNGWVIFYANKQLFYPVVAGAVILVIAIVFLIAFTVRRKRAKNS